MRHIIIGATTFGFTDHAGALRGLTQGGIELGAWRQRFLSDPSLSMPAYLASANIFE